MNVEQILTLAAKTLLTHLSEQELELLRKVLRQGGTSQYGSTMTRDQIRVEFLYQVQTIRKG